MSANRKEKGKMQYKLGAGGLALPQKTQAGAGGLALPPAKCGAGGLALPREPKMRIFVLSTNHLMVQWMGTTVVVKR